MDLVDAIVDQPVGPKPKIIKKVYLSASQQPHNIYADKIFTEEEIMHTLIAKVKPLLESLGFEVKCSDSSKDIKANVAEANAWGADIYISNHSNASGNPEAKNDGTLGLYVSEAGKVLCKFIYDEVAKVTPSTDEGLRLRTDLYELNETKMPAVLLEHFYHDNIGDMKWGLTHLEDLAEAITRGVWKYNRTLSIIS